MVFVAGNNGRIRNGLFGDVTVIGLVLLLEPDPSIGLFVYGAPCMGH